MYDMIQRHTNIGENTWGMVFNATFNNIRVISWQSVVSSIFTPPLSEIRTHNVNAWC